MEEVLKSLMELLEGARGSASIDEEQGVYVHVLTGRGPRSDPPLLRYKTVVGDSTFYAGTCYVGLRSRSGLAVFIVSNIFDDLCGGGVYEDGGGGD